MNTGVTMMMITTYLGFHEISAFQGSQRLSSGLRRNVKVNSMNDLYVAGQVKPQHLSDIGLEPNNKVMRANRDSAVLVQGGSLRTWSYKSPYIEQLEVVLTSEGRPFEADIELWNGPDNTPCKMRVYVENGHICPFSAVIQTPRGPNTVAVRNVGQFELPFSTDVHANDVEEPSSECISSSKTIQGGALRTYQFDAAVDTVQVLLKTDGRPLNARIELLQGPNNNKQVVELYTEDGLDRQFYCILKTPGYGNVVRVVNTAPIEFPMTAGVVPHTINKDFTSGPVIGGDAFGGGNFTW